MYISTAHSITLMEIGLLFLWCYADTWAAGQPRMLWLWMKRKKHKQHNSTRTYLGAAQIITTCCGNFPTLSHNWNQMNSNYRRDNDDTMRRSDYGRENFLQISSSLSLWSSGTIILMTTFTPSLNAKGNRQRPVDRPTCPFRTTQQHEETRKYFFLTTTCAFVQHSFH